MLTDGEHKRMGHEGVRREEREFRLFCVRCYICLLKKRIRVIDYIEPNAYFRDFSCSWSPLISRTRELSNTNQWKEKVDFVMLSVIPEP